MPKYQSYELVNLKIFQSHHFYFWCFSHLNETEIWDGVWSHCTHWSSWEPPFKHGPPGAVRDCLDGLATTPHGSMILPAHGEFKKPRAMRSRSKLTIYLYYVMLLLRFQEAHPQILKFLGHYHLAKCAEMRISTEQQTSQYLLFVQSVPLPKCFYPFFGSCIATFPGNTLYKNS